MRAGIGLLAILIAVAIILMVSFSGPGGGYVTTVVSKGQVAQSQAQQLSGHDDNGMTAAQSIRLEENASNGRLNSLTVKAIVPTGPMAVTFGLIPGDEIIEVGQLRVRDMNNDAELARALTYESYQRNQPLVVIRNGQEIRLTPDSPLTSAHPNLFAPAGATPTGNNPPQQAPQQAPATPAPTPQQQLQNSLNSATKVPTH